jgi:transposase
VDEEMRAAYREEVLRRPFATLTAINEAVRERLPQKPRVSTATVAKHLENQLISVKIAGKDADVPLERNRPENINRRQDYANWLTNLGVTDRIVYIDESGYNIFTRRTQGRAPIGDRVRRRVCGSRGRNINVMLAISADIGLVHAEIGQFTVNGEKFQEFLSDTMRAADAMSPELETIRIVYDGAAPHRNARVPEEYEAGRFSLHILPPYSPFFNPVEQAHSSFKQRVGARLADDNLQRRLRDDQNQRAAQGLNLQQWRARILLDIAREALDEITAARCAAWCARVHRFIPPALAGMVIDG